VQPNERISQRLLPGRQEVGEPRLAHGVGSLLSTGVPAPAHSFFPAGRSTGSTTGSQAGMSERIGVKQRLGGSCHHIGVGSARTSAEAAQ
jgi:hypothetical protein